MAKRIIINIPIKYNKHKHSKTKGKMNAILTKVNTVNAIPFKERIELKYISYPELMKFAQHCHPKLNVSFIECDTMVEATTSKAHYTYRCLSAKYIERYNVTNDTKKYYKIS